MLRVAVIGLRGVPDVMGGIETHCAHLLPRLVAKAPPGTLKITVIARRGYVDRAGRHEGVDQVPLWAPRHRVLETIVHTFLALFYARIALRANCVHLHGIGPGLTAPFARLLGFRLLFTHHGEDYRRQKWGWFPRLALRVGEALAVIFAHRVITVSDATAARLKRRFPGSSDRIVHIPNGFSPVDVDAATPKIPKELAVSPGHFVVTVGRLVPEKAQDLLVEAYLHTDLADRKPSCKLLIVGAADHQSAYADRVKRRAGHGVVMAGRQPRDVIAALNRAAALFVLPSYHEGLSIAALEAIHAGAPVLLSDIKANRAIGLPKRHYFKDGSIQDLSEKLKRDFAEYAVGDDFDLGAFDWEHIAGQTLTQLAALDRRGTLLLTGSQVTTEVEG